MAVHLPPYARLLGLGVERDEAGVIVLRMPFAAPVEGRPGFVQGGAIAGLLEMAALAALIQRIREEGRPNTNWKPVSFTADYMRGARQRDTLASARVTRLGSRIANIVSEAWQEDDPSRLVASARITMLLRPPR